MDILDDMGVSKLSAKVFFLSILLLYYLLSFAFLVPINALFGWTPNDMTRIINKVNKTRNILLVYKSKTDINQFYGATGLIQFNDGQFSKIIVLLIKSCLVYVSVQEGQPSISDLYANKIAQPNAS